MPTINLSGKWQMLYSAELPKETDAIPSFDGAFALDNAVPGYWEDMINDFSSAPFFESLNYNPDYVDIRYPISERVPDMVLKNVVGTFFYKKEIDVPVDTGNRYLFRCEGVQNKAFLYVNGSLAGEHYGYCTPFSFDVTDYIHSGESNSFVLCVNNHQLLNENGDLISGCTSRAANLYSGGIIGDITLEIKNDCYIEDTFVGGYIKETDTFSVNATIKNTNDFCIKWQVADGDTVLVSGDSNTEAFDIKKGDLEFWSDNSPRLYTLKLSLCVDGALCDEAEQEFGIRGIESCIDHIKLNGKTIFLRGICEHGYFAESVHPERDLDYYLKLVRHLKELGFNFVRFHTFIPSEAYMKAADMLGVLLHVECPNNTTLLEWEHIMRFVRRHPSVIICCCGNEMLIDDDMISRLEQHAEISHRLAPHILFSPINALRGVEYKWTKQNLGNCIVKKPFMHNPKRFETLRKFCDVFSSFAQSQLSYDTLYYGNPEKIDSWAPVYNRPRISHEICIHGTYIDLELEHRYDGLRIGETALYSSVREHLDEQGVLDRAPLYFKNSCRWQQLLRKNCMELARRCKKLSGFDFLGVIDHHWHTFGYNCGIMNEFYEMKPGETVADVLRYNNESVILSDLNIARNYCEGESLKLGLSVSLYGDKNIENGNLVVSLKDTDGNVVWNSEQTISAPVGKVSDIANISIPLPKVEKPRQFNVVATLCDGNYNLNNCWEIWVFPEVRKPNTSGIIRTTTLSKRILRKLNKGADVLLIGSKKLYTNDMNFNISCAGRSGGNLATVIEKHPLTDALEHEGFCSWQFFDLMTPNPKKQLGCLCYPEFADVPFDPIIEVASSHKWVIKQAAVAEFRVGKGRLLISTFNHKADNPSVKWWNNNLVSYMKSESFNPKNQITLKQLCTLFGDSEDLKAGKNTNIAGNANDKTMKA